MRPHPALLLVLEPWLLALTVWLLFAGESLAAGVAACAGALGALLAWGETR